jgi:hypothetical protein
LTDPRSHSVIPTGILIAPLMPGINDSREHRPDLVERYERLYAGGAYLPADERRTIEQAAGAPWAGRTYAQRFRHRGAARVGSRGSGRLGGPERDDREEVVPPPQESLF